MYLVQPYGVREHAKGKSVVPGWQEASRKRYENLRVSYYVLKEGGQTSTTTSDLPVGLVCQVQRLIPTLSSTSFEERSDQYTMFRVAMSAPTPGQRQL